MENNQAQAIAPENLEDKALITEKLMETLKATRQFNDIENMTYNGTSYGEFVTVTFIGGGKRQINVTLDSGWALIRDVIRHIDG